MIAPVPAVAHTMSRPQPPGRPFLQIDGVSKSFARGSMVSEVLSRIDLRIDQGEYVAIIGHSGCGKSTLLNIVAGLLDITSGAVLLEDKEVNAPGPDRAVVFQNHSLLPWLTVYDNVRLAVDKVFSGAKSRKERHAWTMHNLELVQMAHAKDKRPMEISGGMKQRVGIARALAMEPKVLLLDEPFGALDALTRAHLQDSVMAIHQKLRNTVLMITHDVDEAVLLAGPHRHDDQRAVGAPSARCWRSSCRDRASVSSWWTTRPTSRPAPACWSSSTPGTRRRRCKPRSEP